MTTSYDERKLGDLCSAVQRNDLKMVQNLLWGDKVNQNTLCWNGGSVPTTPLIITCEAKHYEIVEHLLAVKICPADVNMADGSGSRPIEVAIHEQDVQLLNILLHKGTKKFKPDLNYPLLGRRYHDDETTTPLLMAVNVGNIDIVRELVTAGADVNLQDFMPISPLYKAAESKNTEMCLMLLQNGCEVNAAHDSFGKIFKTKINPIMRLAIHHQNLELMDLLFQHRYRFHEFKTYQRREMIFAIKEYAEASAIKLLQWGVGLSYSNPKSIDYFQLADRRHLSGLMYVMLELNPQLIYTVDLNSTQGMTRFYKVDQVLRTKFVALLKEQRKQPKALKLLCKATILQQLCAKTQIIFPMSDQIEIPHHLLGSQKQIIPPLPSQSQIQTPTKQLRNGAQASTSESCPLYIPSEVNKLPLPMQLKFFLQLSSLDAAQKTINLVVV